jgi:hypothetical protein
MFAESSPEPLGATCNLIESSGRVGVQLQARDAVPVGADCSVLNTQQNYAILSYGVFRSSACPPQGPALP